MDSITRKEVEGKEFFGRVRTFFTRFKIGTILRQCNAYKEQGIPVVTIVLYLFCLAFRNISMYMDLTLNKEPAFCKDTVYRLKNSERINWQRFTLLLSTSIIIGAVEGLTDESRRNALILDDSVYRRNRSKAVELLANVYDHANNEYVRGFRMLTLLWSDGVSRIPVSFCLLSSANEKNRYNEARKVDKRCYGAQIRELAQKKSTDVSLELIAQAKAAKIPAKYVLMDSWFSFPSMITALKKMEFDTIAMVKKSSKVYYKYQGDLCSVQEIYRRNKKRRGRSKYLLSVEVEVGGEDSIPARLVFVRNRNKPSEYLVLLCTDMSLSEEEIIQLYGKRWDIEVFFKTCKSLLKLTGECRSLSYSAINAQTAIVFTRYMFLSLTIREDKDLRSAGPLFCLVSEELADITFSESMEKLQLFLAKLLAGLNLNLCDIANLAAQLSADLPPEIANFLDFRNVQYVKTPAAQPHEAAS